MQAVSIDHIDRKILGLLQTESGINTSAIGERIGLSQSACWRRIQRLREEGVIKDQPVVLDREKVGLTTMVFAHVKLTSHGRSNLSALPKLSKVFLKSWIVMCFLETSISCCALSPRTAKSTSASFSR